MAATPWLERSERGSAFWLRVMIGIARIAGRRVSIALLWPITFFFWLRTPRIRADSLRYLRRIGGPSVGALASFRHYLTFATAILDRYYLLAGGMDRYRVDLHGEEHLIAAVERGKGAFLVGAHLGNFEVARALAHRQPGLRVTLAMYEDNARMISAALRAIDPRLEMDVVALGRVDSMLQIRERLDRGDFVGFLADRSLGSDRTIDVPFLGSPAPFPVSVFRLAAAMGQPVLTMAGLYRGGNLYEVHVEPIADFSTVARGQRAAAVEAATVRFAGRIEQWCRRAPYNWFNFFDFWQEAGRPARTAAAAAAAEVAGTAGAATATSETSSATNPAGAGARVASWLLGLLVATLLVAASEPVIGAQSAAGAWDLAALLADVGRRPQARARFAERQFIGMLDAPVDSTGELFFKAPDRLEKRTTKPRAELLVIDGEQLTMERDGVRRTASLAQIPEAGALVGSLRAVLAGDRAALERVFQVALDGGRERWSLTLSPRDGRTGNLVSKIRIDGVRGEIDVIDIDLAGGDRSVMRVLSVE